MGIRPGRLLVAAGIFLLLTGFAGPAEAAAAPSLVSRYGNGSLGKLSAEQITKLAAQANQRSIIILKDQHAEVPARPNLASRRAQAVEAEQSGIKEELRTLRVRSPCRARSDDRPGASDPADLPL
jgi:hypothetical protein